MKNRISLLFFLTGLVVTTAFSQGVGINDNATAPDPSAGLDINFADKGLLIPRLTTVQRDAIADPADFLMILNTTTRCFEFWDANAGGWGTMSCGCTAPGAPLATAASNVMPASFDANWNSVSGATDYFLDVATDNGFTNLIVTSQNAGNATTYPVSDLTCGTLYYFRVRAENACGAGPYSNTISQSTSACFTCGNSLVDSRDSKSYTTTSIAGSSSPYCLGSSQCWMAQNLNVGTFTIGSTTQTSGGDNQNASIEKYCYADNSATCTSDGGLYQWNEMMAYSSSVSGNGPGPQGVCPAGWHIPTDNEWKCMEMNLGMSQAAADVTDWRGTDQGTKLKTASWGGNNSSGFSALPSGQRNTSSYANYGDYGSLWSSSESDASFAWRRDLGSSRTTVNRDFNNSKAFAFSVRCVKN